jgi:hypothetical protein
MVFAVMALVLLKNSLLAAWRRLTGMVAGNPVRS